MKKLFTLIVIAAFFAASYYLGLFQYFSLDYIKSQQQGYYQFYQQNPFICIGLFFLVYVITTALSFPGAAVLTLLAGALFGLTLGTLIVSFASSIGATLAFLVARFLMRGYVEKQFGPQLSKINKGIQKDGASYLFTLRLIPIVPFFVINLALGLTKMRALTFYIISQIGMLPGTLVYVNAGTQLSQIDSLAGLVSFDILVSFAVLAFFPYITKGLFAFFKNRKLYSKFKKPKKFDYNLVVIGAGSAGLVTSYICAATKGKVALIEKHKMGGDCLNTGCVPSKALIRSAKFAADLKHAESLGFKKTTAEFDFAQIMERVQRVIKKIEPHDSIERYTNLGVDCHIGEAKIISPFEVEVNGKVLSTKNIVLATGASPLIPPIEGINEIDYETSETIWNIREQPKNLLILGGGPIGTELAQAFQRLGTQVTQVEMGSQLMSLEDEDVAKVVCDKLTKEGVNILLNHQAKRFYKKEGKNYLDCLHNNETITLEFDKALIAVGRKANTEGFGLKEIGIETEEKGTVKVDEFLRATYPNVYACGDLIGPYQFTHTASHEAWFCAVNAMVKPFYGFKVDYRVIPWCTYTDPEVARVGLSEKEAKSQGISYDLTTYGIDDLDRAITEEADHGFIKVLTKPGSDKVLGVTIVGLHAGDIIAEYVAAMKHGFGMNKILGTIHIYPTLAEANKFAAGNWKRNQVTESTLKWGERVNRWRRDYI